MIARVALIGNPNCGKTTLFNSLTGLHQKVSNWPGVTVERTVGECQYDGTTFEIIDLPGIYSLVETGDDAIDERITRDFLNHGQFDLILNILDASTLERDLYLTAQLRELERPMVVALNMMDVAKAKGIQIDLKQLSAQLGLEALPVIASRLEGLGPVRQALTAQFLSVQEQPVAEQPTDVRPVVTAHNQPASSYYYQQVDAMVAQVIRQPKTANQQVSDWLDNVFLNRWLAFPLFLLAMYIVFFMTINVGSAFIDFFDGVAGALVVELPRAALTYLQAPIWLTVLVADGVGGGVQLVASFIPVIGMLFLCLVFLEDSGYMSRVAFIVDRLMTKIGLPGRSFVPLIVGFGCNVPSVMATRTLARQNDRLLATIMAPFMSCGARLTVYALFATVFFPGDGLWLVFSLYISGIVLAVISGLAIRRFMLAGDVSALIMALPDYHLPTLRNLLLHTWWRLRGFVLRAGKVIVAVVVVLNLISSWGVDGTFGNENMEKSWLSVIGKKITPAFSPMGVEQDNWPATVGIFTGMFAKEVVVGTLDSLYGGLVNADDASPDEPFELLTALIDAFATIPAGLRVAMGSFTDPLGLSAVVVTDTQEALDEQGVQESSMSLMKALFGSGLAAFSYLMFVLLYVPCIATLGAIYKEYGLFWTGFSTIWSTMAAYVVAVVLYQTGAAMLGLEHDIWFWLPTMTLAAFIGYGLLFFAGRRQAASEQLIPVLQLG